MTSDPCRVSADLREYDSREDRAQRRVDAYAAKAERSVFEKLVDDGMSETEATAFLMTGDGQDLVDAEIDRLDEAADDADTDRRIDEYRDRHL